jgi:hypothetical protein
MKSTLAFLLLLLGFASCKSNEPGQPILSGNEKELWTMKDREVYAHRNDDSTKWDLETLQNDLEVRKNVSWPTKPAISDFPSPVAKYDWGYAAILNLSLEIDDKHITGHSVGYYKDKYNKHLFKDDKDSYLIRFNILILTDLPQPEMRAAQVVSRNYPHYLSTGKQKTSLGEVDWVQMTLANEENFAIVNQRYFDLAYGKTILVAPQKDGSLRILQLQDSPNTIAGIDEGSQKKINDFIQKLRGDKKVVDFFSNTNTID